MPRKLPWKQGGSTAVAKPKRTAAATKSAPKRQRVEKSALESASDDQTASSGKGRADGRGRIPDVVTIKVISD
jgi:hypothetical protein